MKLPGLEKIPDQTGHLVLNEDGSVLSSGGSLENEEGMADILFQLVQLSCKGDILPGDKGESIKRITITYDDHCYSMCLTNRKIHVVQRKCVPQEPINV